MRLKDFQIGAKLMAGFIVVLVLAAAQTLYAVYGTAALNDNAQVMADRWLPATRHAGLLGSHVNRLRAVQFQHLLSFGEDDRRALEKQMDEMRGQIGEDLQNLKTLLVEAEQQQRLQTLELSWKQYQNHQAQITDLARQRRDEEALDILKGPALQTFSELGEHLRTLAADAQAGAQQTRDGSSVVQSRVFYGNLGTLLVTIVLGLLIGRTLSRTIAGGARFAAQLAQRVARGDLSAPIHANSRDEFGQLLLALGEMQEALSVLVRRVREGSEAVASASAQIAQGNQDLSARTENQASSLEETAASMEQLGAAVRHNADNAQQADELAKTASTIVAEGGAAVSEVVNTMKGISASSKKIADIINVIDGIAFQTNILALNAAVEAARAGEQGKGFAVVASEVRALAGRSAAAAKEIKDLINDSVQRIEQGTAQADRAGNTMEEVVAGIRRVTGLITEISSASREQSEGVAQVGEAITHMDQNTQQNAALVEQMTAAAASLQTQAEDLVQTVAVFKLAGETDAAPQTAALPAPGEPRLLES